MLYSSSSSHHDKENNSLPLSKIVIHRQMAFVEFLCTRFPKRRAPIGKAGDVRWGIARNVLNPFVSLRVVFHFSAWGRTEDSRLFVRVSLWVLEATYLLCLFEGGRASVFLFHDGSSARHPQNVMWTACSERRAAPQGMVYFCGI